MPDETKGTDPVSPESASPTGAPAKPGEGAGSGGAKAPAETSQAAAAPVAPPPSAKAGAPDEGKPEPVKPASPGATAAKSAEPAKPAAPAAAKPAPKPEGPKPEPWDSELVTRLRSQYGSGIKEASTYVGQKYLVVDSSIVYEILLRMRQDELFDYCVDITAVHYPKREVQFDIVYILYSFHHNERVRVKTQIKDGERLRTAVEIWETANWLEREVFDMFGIEFDGHPDLKRILLPDGWKGHPLRKDYPILQQDQEWVQINLGIESGQ
ncbi:MAG: NADH-quinone oxidoreductase subunit C [Candidatus Korobacteraceae bacterium]